MKTVNMDSKKVARTLRRSAFRSYKFCNKFCRKHPISAILLCLFVMLYIVSPWFCFFLVYNSPVLISTALLLGALLSFGQPHIPHVDDVEEEQEEEKESEEEDEESVLAQEDEVASRGLGDFLVDSAVRESTQTKVSKRQFEEGLKDDISTTGFVDDNALLEKRTEIVETIEEDNDQYSVEVIDFSDSNRDDVTSRSIDLVHEQHKEEQQAAGIEIEESKADETVEEKEAADTGILEASEVHSIDDVNLHDNSEKSESDRLAPEVKGRYVLIDNRDLQFMSHKGEEAEPLLGMSDSGCAGAEIHEEESIASKVVEIDSSEEASRVKDFDRETDKGSAEGGDSPQAKPTLEHIFRSDLRPSWRRLGHARNASGSSSDAPESLSPDASLANMEPMFDELHPLLDYQASNVSKAFSQSDSEAGETSGAAAHIETSAHEAGDASFDEQDHEDEEEDEEEDELHDDFGFTWTEDDEKNLRDLGLSQMEMMQLEKKLSARHQEHPRQTQEENLIHFHVQERASFIDGENLVEISFPGQTSAPAEEHGFPEIQNAEFNAMQMDGARQVRKKNPFDIDADISTEHNLQEGVINQPFPDSYPPAAFQQEMDGFQPIHVVNVTALKEDSPDSYMQSPLQAPFGLGIPESSLNMAPEAVPSQEHYPMMGELDSFGDAHVSVDSGIEVASFAQSTKHEDSQADAGGHEMHRISILNEDSSLKAEESNKMLPDDLLSPEQDNELVVKCQGAEERAVSIERNHEILTEEEISEVSSLSGDVAASETKHSESSLDSVAATVGTIFSTAEEIYKQDVEEFQSLMASEELSETPHISKNDDVLSVGTQKESPGEAYVESMNMQAHLDIHMDRAVDTIDEISGTYKEKAAMEETSESLDAKEDEKQKVMVRPDFPAEDAAETVAVDATKTGHEPVIDAGESIKEHESVLEAEKSVDFVRHEELGALHSQEAAAETANDFVPKEHLNSYQKAKESEEGMVVTEAKSEDEIEPAIRDELYKELASEGKDTSVADRQIESGLITMEVKSKEEIHSAMEEAVLKELVKEQGETSVSETESGPIMMEARLKEELELAIEEAVLQELIKEQGETSVSERESGLQELIKEQGETSVSERESGLIMMEAKSKEELESFIKEAALQELVKEHGETSVGESESGLIMMEAKSREELESAIEEAVLKELVKDQGETSVSESDSGLITMEATSKEELESAMEEAILRDLVKEHGETSVSESETGLIVMEARSKEELESAIEEVILKDFIKEQGETSVSESKSGLVILEARSKEEIVQVMEEVIQKHLAIVQGETNVPGIETTHVITEAPSKEVESVMDETIPKDLGKQQVETKVSAGESGLVVLEARSVEQTDSTIDDSMLKELGDKQMVAAAYGTECELLELDAKSKEEIESTMQSVILKEESEEQTMLVVSDADHVFVEPEAESKGEMVSSTAEGLTFNELNKMAADFSTFEGEGVIVEAKSVEEVGSAISNATEEHIENTDEENNVTGSGTAADIIKPELDENSTEHSVQEQARNEFDSSSVSDDSSSSASDISSPQQLERIMSQEIDAKEFDVQDSTEGATEALLPEEKGSGASALSGLQEESMESTKLQSPEVMAMHKEISALETAVIKDEQQLPTETTKESSAFSTPAEVDVREEHSSVGEENK